MNVMLPKSNNEGSIQGFWSKPRDKNGPQKRDHRTARDVRYFNASHHQDLNPDLDRANRLRSPTPSNSTKWWIILSHVSAPTRNSCSAGSTNWQQRQLWPRPGP